MRVEDEERASRRAAMSGQSLLYGCQVPLLTSVLYWSTLAPITHTISRTILTSQLLTVSLSRFLLWYLSTIMLRVQYFKDIVWIILLFYTQMNRGFKGKIFYCTHCTHFCSKLNFDRISKQLSYNWGLIRRVVIIY